MDQPKVLVGCPTFEGFGYCLDVFLERMRELSYPNRDLLLVDNSVGDVYFERLRQSGVNVLKAPRLKSKWETVANSRNLIIDYALRNGFDFLLSLDQDVIPPKDVIEELLKCGKDVVSGLYFGVFGSGGKLKNLPVAYKGITGEEFELMRKTSGLPSFVKSHAGLKRNLTVEELGQGVQEVKIPSNGCMLIKRVVLENREVRFGTMGVSEFSGDEILFCESAKQHGFKLFVDPKVRCKHLVLSGNKVLQI